LAPRKMSVEQQTRSVRIVGKCVGKKEINKIIYIKEASNLCNKQAKLGLEERNLSQSIFLLREIIYYFFVVSIKRKVYYAWFL
jgi:hypothetical protein